MACDFKGGKKILLASDTYTELVDQICDVLLLVGGDRSKFDEVFERAYESAYHTHYLVERDGESDGTYIYVSKQDGTNKLVPLAEYDGGVEALPHAERLVKSLRANVEVLGGGVDVLGPPPPELADAWERYQHGGDVESWELSKLDEWRAERAEADGY